MMRSILTVSTGTLASRLLGFLRDAMMAALLGAGPVADAFLAAFQLVNVVRRLLTEGALNAALVPAWLRHRDREGDTAAARFAGGVLGTISAIVLAVALLIALLMPEVMSVVAPGFAGSATRDLAVTDARWMMPYLAFAGPTTVLLALASAQGRFVLTAFSPLLFNLALIAVMVVLISGAGTAETAATVLAMTIGAVGLLQLALLGAGRRIRTTATPVRVTFDAGMRGFLGRAWPAMLASAAPQLLIVAGAVIGSHAPSAVSWLYFANRLVELPLGIVGVAMGTVLVPALTLAVRSGDQAAIAHAESRALELAVGLAMPAALGLAVLGEPIVRLLFEHGAFTAADRSATAQALGWLASALPAHVLVKVLAPAFYAREEVGPPMLATLAGVVITLASAVLLDGPFGATGIAAAIALGAWTMAAVLVGIGRSRFGFAVDPDARRRLPRIVLASAAMAAVLLLAAQAAGPWLLTAHGAAEALVLFGLIGGGIAGYLLLLRLAGVLDRATVVNALRRGT